MVKTDYSWNEIISICKSIVTSIRESPIPMSFSCVWAIPRGGLVPARILSELLNVERIVTNIHDILPNEFVLIVDDISDSGKTLIHAVNKFQETFGFSYKVATLFVRDGTHYQPNFYGQRLYHDKWIEFPWEMKMLESIEPNQEQD